MRKRVLLALIISWSRWAEHRQAEAEPTAAAIHAPAGPESR